MYFISFLSVYIIYMYIHGTDQQNNILTSAVRLKGCQGSSIPGLAGHARLSSSTHLHTVLYNTHVLSILNVNVSISNERLIDEGHRGGGGGVLPQNCH